ncbi:phage portal protein [Clostridium sp. BJN0001]|uniref:phage portal protein n=1 Tax=Clostridium sp. BJN0001 TaxID=2930219 RepID=UPI001FD1059F|nr:phage portal protein [Clostridium sp. BJN0001]
MKLFNLFRNVGKSERIKIIADYGEGFYAWNGKLYESDVIRACIRPKVNAIGKLEAKHIRDDGKKIQINPEPYIRFLLEEPNPYMCGQVLQMKVETQLALNNNAFILIIKNEFGLPCELYPINCTGVNTKYVGDNKELWLQFYLTNGKLLNVPYTEVIHLRNDYNSKEIFGDSNGKALEPLMNVVGTIDQGTVKAIKNSGVVRWLLKYATSLRPEDLKKNVKEFVNNYLSTETDTLGAAGVDSKVDAQRIEPKDFVPNAAQQDRTIKRLFSFFNTNEKIVQSDYTEDEWNSYYESQVEPDALQWKNEYTRKIFNRNQRSFGNYIVFEAINLACASITTKLGLVSMVDRGALTPNEWRAVFNLTPIDGGDVPIRRLDTAPTTEGNTTKGGES